MWYNLFWKRLDLVQSHIEWKLWELLVAGTMVASWPAPWLRSKCPNKVLLLLSPPLHHFPYLMTPLKQIKTLFLSDPSPIIGNACHSLTDSLPFSKLDWCGPGVWRCQLKTCWGCYCCLCWCWGSCWQQIWELTLGPKAKLLFRVWAKGLVKILKLKFSQDFEAGVVSVFCFWCFVEVMKLNLGRDSKARFGQDF